MFSLSLPSKFLLFFVYHGRSVKSPTYYWENGTETLEMCKDIYLYSNKNLKYHLLYTPMGTYIIK